MFQMQLRIALPWYHGNLQCPNRVLWKPVLIITATNAVVNVRNNSKLFYFLHLTLKLVLVNFCIYDTFIM